MSAVHATASVGPRVARRRAATSVRRQRVAYRLAAPPLLALVAACAAAALGCLSLASTTCEAWPLPLLGLLTLSLVLLQVFVVREHRRIDPTIVVVFGLSLVGLSVCGGLAQYFAVPGLSAVVHRSMVSAIVLLGLAIPAACTALYYLRGATPEAEDLARYPVVVAPVVLALGLYGVLVFDLVQRGVAQLSTVGLAVLVQPMLPGYLPPYMQQTGLLNQLLGSGLLVGLTLLFATPIGIAAGLFVAEIGRGLSQQAVRFATAALRGISVFLLALATSTLIAAARDTPWRYIFAGMHDRFGQLDAGRGSFLTAALALSLLTIPLIARATEEGCVSLPRGLREGSAALGATADYTLWRIVLPWALPYVMTGVILAAAEAAGSLAVIVFMPGTGEYGVGVLNDVATLPSAIFGAQYNPTLSFRRLEGSVQYVAGLLLLVLALGLTSIALLLKRRYVLALRGTTS